MTDPLVGTGLVLWGAKDILLKLLGPTADYIGKEAKDVVKKGNENMSRIVARAVKLLDSKLEQPGVVSPRVLRHIINEGIFCEDELSAEYFGGILASARSGVSRDDRGMAMISLLSSMSTYQIRTHYVFYTIAKRLFEGKDIQVGIAKERQTKMPIFVPFSLYEKCMDFSEEENANTIPIFNHVIYGLVRLSLIDEYFAFGSVEHIRKEFYPNAEEAGIFFVPTVLGIELYAWAHGYANIEKNEFLNKEFHFQKSDVLTIPTGATAVKNL